MEDDDLLPLSALQHLVYCPRQCALIHGQQQWADNRFTAEGNVLHRHVDEAGTETRGPLRIARGVPLVCRRLGLSGRADVVEYRHTDGGGQGAQAWLPRPVEYKRGAPKPHDADAVQLCAQALCLEEMHGCSIPDGDLFYGASRRRRTVAFDEALRQRTEQVAADLRTVLAAETLPPPTSEKARCRACSLEETCRPTVAVKGSAAAWLRRAQEEGEGEADCANP